MTNETSYAPITYVCNGVTVDFTFPWKIFEEKDLIVQAQGESGLLRELTLGVDYSVEFDEVGGNVKLNQTYAEGNLVVISRNVPDYQSKSYSTSSGFQSSEIEDSFDRVSCNLQEMEYNIENFKEVFSAQVHDEIDALENVIEENKQEVLLIQERFEEEVGNEIANLKTDVDSKVADVADAADKINALDESIAKCESAASEASEQAEIAANKADEILNVKDELEAEIENKADIDLSNLSEVGKKKLGAGGGAYIGQTIFSFDPLVEDTLHLLDGDLLSVGGMYNDFINTYISNLYAKHPQRFCSEEEWQSRVSTYGVCGKYVYTEGVSVRLPRVTGFVEGTLDVNALGELVEAGLPNIEGNVTGLFVATSASATGALTLKKTNTAPQTNGSSYLGDISLNASLVNPIYNNSDTVQPQAIQGYCYIVVANGSKTEIEVDIDNIATDLNDKANKTDVDGQWVFKKLSTGTFSVTATPVEFDLSDYLPNDGYEYLVASAANLTSTVAGNVVAVYGDGVDSENCTIRITLYAPNANKMHGTAGLVLVDANRKLKVSMWTGQTGQASVAIRGYRRLGKNI